MRFFLTRILESLIKLSNIFVFTYYFTSVRAINPPEGEARNDLKIYHKIKKKKTFLLFQVFKYGDKRDIWNIYVFKSHNFRDYQLNERFCFQCHKKPVLFLWKRTCYPIMSFYFRKAELKVKTLIMKFIKFDDQKTFRKTYLSMEPLSSFQSDHENPRSRSGPVRIFIFQKDIFLVISKQLWTKTSFQYLNVLRD